MIMDKGERSDNGRDFKVPLSFAETFEMKDTNNWLSLEAGSMSHRPLVTASLNLDRPCHR